MQIQTSFLASRGWLWSAVLLSLIALAAFIWHAPPAGRDGSTIVGYGLGGVSAAIVVWLSLLGIRKRRFASSANLRRNSVSAHVFLGLTLVATATLHSGFEFEWSLHTLTYVLAMIVVASGIWGVIAYAQIPDKMSRNLADMIVEKKRFDMSELEQLEMDMEETDSRLTRALGFLPDDFRPAIQRSLERTKIGGGLVAQLSGSSRGCATAAAAREVRNLIDKGNYEPDVRRRLSDLVRDLARKQAVAAALRRDARYRAFLSLWLWLHVPLTSALLVALIGHVVLVFFYW